MPTRAEKKALWFLGAVIILGGGVRALGARQPAVATSDEQQALSRQISASDSASRAGNRGRRPSAGAKVARRKPADGATAVGGVESVGPSYARPSDPFSARPYGAAERLDRRGFPPPLPRIDIGGPVAPVVALGGRGRPAAAVGTGGLVDVDRASAAELEALPRIGPALAARILVARDSMGGFGSLERLGRVRGIGPAMLATLAPLVVFSAPRRP